MRVGRSGPHDVRARVLVCHGQSRGFGVEWPHDHPMRTYIDGHTRRIIRIGIAALRSARQHISDARDCVGRLGLVSLGVCEPLHGSCIDTHGWLADNVWIARHAREAVAAFAQDHFIALCICIDDSCGLRNVIWSRGHCSSYFSCVVSPAFAEVCDSARPTSLSPNTRSRVVAVTAVAMNLRLELSDLISFLL